MCSMDHNSYTHYTIQIIIRFSVIHFRPNAYLVVKLILKVGLIRLGLLSTVYEIFGNPRDLL